MSGTCGVGSIGYTRWLSPLHQLSAHGRLRFRERRARVWQVFVLSMAGSLATGCVGAWRAISTGNFLASVQVMALAWLVLLATDVMLLFGDGGNPPFPLPPTRASHRDRGGLRNSAPNHHHHSGDRSNDSGDHAPGAQGTPSVAHVGPRWRRALPLRLLA